MIITKNTPKLILGFIFDHLKGVPLLLRSLGGEVLIIDKELTKEDLLTVDDCLKYNFKMYSVPSIYRLCE
jgi:hypothetical protein